MAVSRIEGKIQPGIRWGPFTLRIPLYHLRIEWAEWIQGIFVAGATGLALVPLLTDQFGLSFAEAIAFAFIQSMLIASAPIIFGEPFAPGWITPALPLVLAILGDYDTPTQRFQMMTALALNLAAILLIFGITGLGKRLMQWLPNTIKAGIIFGSAIAAFKRVFLDDIDKFLLHTPIATIAALAMCIYLTFSASLQRYKKKYKIIEIIASLGLLPGFLIAALLGPLVGEIHYQIEWGLLLPPISSLWQKSSPFVIGWPTWQMFLQSIPLALISYTILFGDLITASEITLAAATSRPDEHIDIDIDRSHYSLAIRNTLMAILAPFFPTQGCLWTGVHVIIVQRWQQGRDKVDSLFGAIASYYMFGIPLLFLILPAMTGLKPLMHIALSLTLLLTGFVCSYVAIGMVKKQVEQGVMLLMAMTLAVFSPWIGLLVGIIATLVLVDWWEKTGEKPE